MSGDSIATKGEGRSIKSFSSPLASFHGNTLCLQPIVPDFDFGKVRGAVVHEYGACEPGSLGNEPSPTSVTNNYHDLRPQAHPNPFNPSTRIRFTFFTAGAASLRIFDVNGRLVRERHAEQRSAGEHTILWKGKDQAGQLVANGLLC